MKSYIEELSDDVEKAQSDEDRKLYRDLLHQALGKSDKGYTLNVAPDSAIRPAVWLK